MLQSLVRPLLSAVSVLLPMIISACQTLHGIYAKLPMDAVYFQTGVVFCFFGGLYPTLFAAIQAAKHSGIRVLGESLKSITDEAIIVLEENRKDDLKDDDKDGVSDVDQMSNSDLVLRKANLVMTKINPIKVDAAIAAMYTVWISVLAVLTLQFARTISLALTISNFLKRPIDDYVAPTVAMAVPKNYQKWVPVILGWIAKSVGMSVAWTIQAVISAFTSACEGGLIMSRIILKQSYERGYTFGGLIPANHEDTKIDEYLSFLFAALGFYFQYKLGFDVPFPFNILLFPFEIAEYYIKWTITN